MMNQMMNQMMNPDFNASREAMLLEVDQAGFAVVDANLYLDTHPCDAAAIDYYNQMANAYRNAAAAFEAQFGPLTASANREDVYKRQSFCRRIADGNREKNRGTEKNRGSGVIEEHTGNTQC